ncbi:Uncharacterised protein [Mycobacteroides abscessus subsp. abscessus]|nr:Uncharacterised protein [Mycobacteroides abscessus subsp. abscessus]
MASTPETSAGRPDTVVPNTTSWLPVSQHSSWAYAACSTVLTVVCRDRANSPAAVAICAGSVTVSTRRGPDSVRPAGPTNVGVSRPRSSSPHAAVAAWRSRSASQLT